MTLKKLMLAVVASAVCACGAFAAYDYTYYAATNGTDEADCLSPESAGSFANVVAKAYEVPTGKTVSLVFADGEYDATSYTNAPTKTAKGAVSVLYHDEGTKRYWTFSSASGNPTNCCFVGTGDESKPLRFLTIYRMYSHVVFNDIGFKGFKGPGAVIALETDGHNQSDAKFNNCRFEDNGLPSSQYGGVVTTGITPSTFNNCYFTNNVSCFGGVVRGHGTNQNSKFYDCEFVGNKAVNSGSNKGTGSVAYNVAYFSNCVFRANRGSGSVESAPGAVMFWKSKANGQVIDCTFEDNYSAGSCVCLRGGKASSCRFYRNNWNEGDHAAAVFYGAVVDRCEIVSNRAVTAGGDTLKNCLIAFNRVETRTDTPIIKGSGSTADKITTCENCTIVSNYAHGASWNWNNSTITIYSVVKNCILADNDTVFEFGCDGTDATKATQVYTTYYSGAINNSEKGTVFKDEGSKKISYADCKFQTVGGRPFMPKRKSCLVDAGADFGQTSANLDLAGASRVFGKAIDIGCYENHEPAPGLMLVIW